MLKRYYSVAEACAFIASETKAEFSCRDLFDLAWRGEIGLCFYLGSVVTTLFDPVSGYPVTGTFDDGARRYFLLPFQGYVCIDPAELRPDMSFPLEVARYTLLENQLQDLVQPIADAHPPGRWLAYTPKVWRAGLDLIPHDTEPDIFKVTADQLVIPADQLLTLCDGSINLKDKPPPATALASKGNGDSDDLKPLERQTLLKLIITMAVKRYRYDPQAARNDATSLIAEHATELGIGLTDDTVRKWLKVAANTLLPKKPPNA